MAVYRSILKQMNAKLKSDLYRLKIPLKNVMVVGVDYCQQGKGQILGFVSSYNQHLAQYYSQVVNQPYTKENEDKSKDEQCEIATAERTTILKQFVKSALETYQTHNNGALPENILIYRDGVGGPQMKEKLKSVELEDMINAMTSFTQGYKPKILYCLIDKKISHRLFDKDSQGNFKNPGPGTVLDTGLVENDGDVVFDFLMIPHHATIATALPVHFDVAYNSTGMKKNDVEILTYHLCYGYANFCGSVKVPAACKYAEKLVNYAHDLKIKPNERLSLNLHYL